MYTTSRTRPRLLLFTHLVLAVVLFRVRLSRRGEAQHHYVAAVGAGQPEAAVGAVETVQDAQDSETVVEPRKFHL